MAATPGPSAWAGEGLSPAQNKPVSERLVCRGMLSGLATAPVKEPPKLCLKRLWVALGTVNSMSALSRRVAALLRFHCQLIIQSLDLCDTTGVSHTPEQDACCARDAPDEVISWGMTALDASAVALPGPTLLTMGLPRPCLHFPSFHCPAFHHPPAAQLSSARCMATCCHEFRCPCHSSFHYVNL